MFPNRMDRPIGGLPRWTAADEANLARRIQRVWRGRCEPCETDNHAHASAQVGPYLICRCLRCDVLVVTP